MMPIINDFKKTEQFIASKLVDAQLDRFCVYSVDLQLEFIGGPHGNLQNYWLCMTGGVSVSDNQTVYCKPADVIANLYTLIGQRVNAVKIEDKGKLLLTLDSKVITLNADDESLEIIWSLTPESPDTDADHEWSII